MRTPDREHRWLIEGWVAANPYKAGAYRAAIIEECARTVDRFDGDVLASTEDGRWVRQSEVAAAIRSLKDKP